MLAQSSDPDPEGDERNPRCFWIGPEYICPPNPTRPPTDPPPPPTPCNADPVTFECLPPPTPPPTATKPPPPTATKPPPPTATHTPRPTSTDPPPTPTPVIIVIPPLNAPALSGRVSGTSLTLTWTEVTQAGQYEVQERRVQCRSERGQQRCGEIWWLTVRSTTGLTETFSGLTVGSAYAYRVCSYRGIDRLTVCSGGQTWTIDPTATPIPESTPTETPVPTATPLPVPPAPSLTVTVPPPHNEIRVSWPAVAGVTIYKLAYGPTDGSENTTSDIYPPSTSLSVAPGCGVTTYFKARSYGDGTRYARSWGPWSASEDETTAACNPSPGPSPTPVTCRDAARCNGPTPTRGPLTPPPPGPSVPPGLEGRPHSTGKIVLEWEGAGTNVVYQVQQRKHRRLWGLFPQRDRWETLPYDVFKLNGSTSNQDIDDTSVVVSGLEDEQSYKHRVRSVRGDQSSDWSTEFETTLPLPHFGRQADHIVQYELDPSVMHTAIPRTIPTAIAEARVNWQIAGSLLLPVSFCRKDAGECRYHVNDGRTVLIKVVEPTSYYSSLHTPSPPILDCGSGPSCVGARQGRPRDLGDEDGYIKDLEMRIEVPGHLYSPIDDPDDPDGDRNKYYEWTLNVDMHLNPVPFLTSSKFYYLVHVLMHEFGHTLGLEDLSKYGISGDYLMVYHPIEKTFTEISDKEIDYVREVYRGHTPQALPPTTVPRPPPFPMR